MIIITIDIIAIDLELNIFCIILSQQKLDFSFSNNNVNSLETMLKNYL